MLFFDTKVPPEAPGRGGNYVISGAVFNSNLIIARRNVTEPSTYPQMLGYAVSGPERGNRLDVLPAVITEWNFWKTLHPESLILNEDPQFPQYDYQSLGNPYTGYWRNDAEIRAPICHTDGRLLNKALVMGIFGEGTPMAVRMEDESFVYNTRVDDRPVSVVYLATVRSGWTFERMIDGQEIELEWAGFRWRSIPMMVDDGEEPSYWTPEGVAVAGPHAGKRLRWIPSMNSYWFAWVAFYPETELWDPLTGEQL